MLKKLIILAFLLSSPCFLWSQGGWSQIANFGGVARDGAVSFCIGNYGYVGTGYDGSNYKNDLWQYDIANNVWTQVANFTGLARTEAVGFAIGDKGYIGTGTNYTTKFADFYEYNPTTNEWTQKASLPGNADVAARNGAFSFVIDGKGYVGCGNLSSGYSRTFFEFDPIANTWTSKAQLMGEGRGGAAAFALNGKGYAGTGHGGIFEVDFYEYNPLTNTWSQKSNFGGGSRTMATGFSLGNKGYFATGFNGSYKNDMYEYNPTTNVWTLITPQFLGSGRRSSTVFVNEDFAFLGLGNDGAYKNDFFKYDPNISISTGNIPNEPYFVGESTSIPFTINGTFLTENVFTAQLSDASGSFANPVNIGTLESIASGSIEVTFPLEKINGTGFRVRVISSNPSVCGSNNGENIRIINNWLQKANFGGTARYSAVGFSIGTKSYIGTGAGTGAKNDFWEYDPATNLWTQKANIGGAARINAVGFSIGNKGYIGTGENNNGKLNDFWEFDPATNLWTQKANFGGTARINAVGFSIGNKGYIGTGFDNNFKNDFWEYDPVTNFWSQKANFGGVARFCAIGFSINTKGFIGTGYDENYNHKNDFWEYDPATNLWVQKANFGGTPRYGAVGFSIGLKGYIGTGEDESCRRYDFWEYDPTTNLWAQKTNFGGTGRYNSVGFSIGTKGYIGTGDDGNIKNDFWEYSSHIIITKSLPLQNSYMQGALILIPFKVSSAFNEGNVFKVQLSDASGSFANPIIFDSLQSTTSGIFLTNIPVNVFPGTNYRVRVVGTNPEIIGEDNGANITIQTEVQTPTLVSPTNTSTGIQSTPNFVWNSVPNAISYRLQVSSSSSFSNLKINETAITDTSFTSNTALNLNTTYYWRVAVLTANGLSAWSSPWNFKTIIGPPTLTAPVNFATGVLTNPTFIWSSVTGATTYNLQLSTTPDFSSTVLDLNNLTGTSYASSGLNYSTLYFWRMSSTNASGTSPWSDYFTFTTGVGAPNLLYPPNTALGIATNPTLVWNVLPTALVYQLQVSTNANFTSTIVNQQYLVDTTYSVPSLSNNTTYYWRVRATIEGGSNTVWSSVWNFKTKLAAPTLVSPANNAVAVVLNPNFSWNSVTSATSYNIHISTNSEFADTTILQNEISGTSYAASGLVCATQYFWRVSANNAGGASNWSTSRTFTTLLQGPNLTLPENNVTGLILNPQFEWNEVVGYSAYNLQVSSSADFSTTYFDATNITSISYTVPTANTLITNTTYYWRVRGTNPNNTDWSEVWSFTTGSGFPNSWMRKADVGNIGRNRGVGFSIGNKGYIGTGGGTNGDDFWEYDPVTDIWTQKANFAGTARSGAVGFSIENKGYIGTGYDYMTKNDFWEYDPVTNQWIQKANYGGTPRNGAIGFSIGNKGFIGRGGSEDDTDFWEYDPASDQWTQKADFSVDYYVNTGFSIGNKGYVGAYYFWEYDPVTNQWAQKTNFGVTEYGYFSGFSIGNKGYICYTKDSDKSIIFKEYDPLTDQWTQKAKFIGDAREGAVGFSIGNKGYIGTGKRLLSPKINLNDFYEYTPDSYSIIPPILAVPTDNAANISVNPTFVWYEAFDATHYNLQVSNDEAFSNILYDVDNITSLSYSVSGLSNNTTYYWRVQSGNAAQTSEWSFVYSFTTEEQTIITVPDTWEYTSNTGNSASIIVPFAIDPQIGNRSVSNGDAIGLFFTRNDSLICAGYSIWAGSNLGIMVWGDDDMTEIKDGFDANEIYTFKIWDALAGREYIANATFSVGNDFYTVDGFSVLSSLNASTTFELSLNNGWNLISSYVIPTNPELEEMFEEVSGNVRIMKQGNGMFVPEWNINTIGDWNYKKGYQLSMYNEDILPIQGALAVPQFEAINMSSGWNIIGYLRSGEMNIENAFATINDNINLAKNNTGGIYSPAYGINTLGNMLPGEGYFVFMNNGDILTYPANTAQKSVLNSNITPLAKQLIPQFKNTGNNANLILELNEIENGNEVGIYNMNNELIGSGAVHNGVVAITIWGDDEVTNEIDGALNDEFLTIKLLNSNNSLNILSLYNIREITGNTELDNLSYQTDAIYTAKAALPQENELSFSISSIPNPTSSNTTFEFYLTDESEAEIEIYTLTGELVANIPNSSYTTGMHKVNFDASQLSNGVYNVILRSGNQRAMTMMVIEK